MAKKTKKLTIRDVITNSKKNTFGNIQMEVKFGETQYLKFRFVCPKCGSNSLIQVRMGIEEWGYIDEIFENRSIFDAVENNSDGHISGYKCNNCPFILKLKNGRRAKTHNGLLKWLKENNAQSYFSENEIVGNINDLKK
jgi:predicted RNA-binding Zn-ribbon protein involved in translation (DUF1610 family)